MCSGSGSPHGDDPEQLFGNFNYGKVLILINRGDYFQGGLHRSEGLVRGDTASRPQGVPG